VQRSELRRLLQRQHLHPEHERRGVRHQRFGLYGLRDGPNVPQRRLSAELSLQRNELSHGLLRPAVRVPARDVAECVRLRRSPMSVVLPQLQLQQQGLYDHLGEPRRSVYERPGVHHRERDGDGRDGLVCARRSALPRRLMQPRVRVGWDVLQRLVPRFRPGCVLPGELHRAWRRAEQLSNRLRLRGGDHQQHLRAVRRVLPELQQRALAAVRQQPNLQRAGLLPVTPPAPDDGRS
jgi:hypothetical protein